MERVTQCRSCGSSRLFDVLDLGSTPIANDLIDPGTLDTDGEVPDPAYPLAVVFCEDCALVQLAYALPADAIFGADYPYYSSVSDALLRHSARHVEELIAARNLTGDSFVVEVASNDGYLLRNFVAAGVPTLGIEPSPGPAAVARDLGVATIVEFFGRDVATSVVADHGRADVIVANNVMAHVPDLNDFVGGLAILLADDGELTVENPGVKDLVERVEFDTIYHEHFCYFSCIAVDALFRRHGLHLNDVDYFHDLHGGTMRWHGGHHDERTERCTEFLAAERDAGLDHRDFYATFAAKVGTCQTALRELLIGLREEGHIVVGYGAAAKGATLLNSTGIGTDLVSWVVDRNEHKQGLLMPGCRLPIRPVETLLESQPDALLLLAWNFASEIVEQQHDYAQRGGRFFVPAPVAHEIFPAD